jgi:hypothetical protein
MNTDQLNQFVGYYELTNPRAEIGRFIDELTGARRCFLSGGVLFQKDLFQPSQRLIPTGGGQFRLAQQPDASMIFIPGPNGKMVLAGRSAFYERINPFWPEIRVI